MNILTQLSIFGVSLSFALGLMCAWLGSYSIRMLNRTNSFAAELHELGYLGFLKIFALAIFATFGIIPILGIYLTVSAFNQLIIMGDEAAFVVFGVACWLSLGSLVALIQALKRPSVNNIMYLEITSEMEPELHKLSRDLARQFRTKHVPTIHLTPDLTIRIREDIRTLDNVYYGGAKTWEIGLGALQCLSAPDLRILMAKEYAYLAYGRDRSGQFAARLNKRLDLMKNNIQNGGLLLLLNPVAWLIILVGASARFISGEALSAAEIRTQRLVSKIFGEQKLFRAITRHAVEAEIYKDIIPGPRLKRQPGQPEMENIYYYMRLGNGPSMAESRAIAEAMLFNSNSGKNRLGLTIKRQPEINYYRPFSEQPATSFLANNRKTETRMMELVNYGS